MTGVGTRIRITTQGDELKGPSESLRNSVLDQGRLSNTGWTGKKKTESATIGIGDLAANELHDLEFGFVLTIDSIVETLLGGFHECSAFLRTVFQTNRDLLVDTEWNTDNLIEPCSKFKVFIARCFECLKTVVLGKDSRLDFFGEFHGKNAEHEIESISAGGRTIFECND